MNESNDRSATGYALSRRWFAFAFETKECKVQHTALFMWIIELNNRLGWKKEIGIPTADTMEGLSIGNKNTYLDALRDIAKWGFIEIVKESKNQYQACIISLCHSKSEPASGTALDTALIQHEVQHRYGTGYGIGVSIDDSIGFSIDTIDKPINKETSKQINQETIKADSPKVESVTVIEELNFSFQEFWDLYDKKVGKKDKLEKKWKNLKPDERRKAMEYLPGYLKAQPKKQFRKNPETFLNNESWNDELINENNGITKSTSATIEQRQAERDGLGELANGVLAKIAAQYSS